MSKQILFCVEASQKAKTDKVYIDETIDRFYQLGNDIRKRFIFLDGKGNYNKPKIIKEIATHTKQFGLDKKTIVIYCVDTDKYDSDPIQAKELEDIEQYCIMNDYKLIWFCRDVEDVYWGEQVKNSEKTQKAAQFRRGRKINGVMAENLNGNRKVSHHSNILAVLDKCMERK